MGIDMSMRYCRKLFSSWLYQSGIPEITINFLSGRVSGSWVFASHYMTPSADLKEKVLLAVEGLSKKLDITI
jgi:intergrase/recombinase